MDSETWHTALTLFQQNPTYDTFSKLTEVLPFEVMVQYPLMDESANDFVVSILPVIDACLDFEEVLSEYVVKPSMVRICQLSDLPVREPLLPDGSDLIEKAEQFVGLIRGWTYVERHPDRRIYIHKVLLVFIRIYGATALCVPDEPALRIGLDKFSEWICGIWLNLLDAQNAKIATSVTDLLQTINRVDLAHSRLPKSKHFRDSVISLKNFDDNLSRWLKHELSADERDVVHQWTLDLTSGLLARVNGEATLLGDCEKDSCRIRAAVALIRLSDLSPALRAASQAEHWCLAVVENLYFTDDALLKLAAGEVIIEEIFKSEAMCACLFENKILFRIVDDLDKVDPACSTSEISSKTSLRLLANVFEKVPASREVLAKYPKFIKHVRSVLLNENPIVNDQAMAISCVGAIMSDINPDGVKLIARDVPEWKAVFERVLISGDEHSTTACVMALARMIVGSQPQSGYQVARESITEPIPDAEYLELRNKILKTCDENFTPLLIKCTYPKPFPAVRVYIYQVFEGLMVNHGLFGSVDLYSSSPKYMEQLFNCPSDKLHDVVLARHHYIKRVRLLYTFKDKEFESAIDFCSNHGPYDKPPLFAGESGAPLVEDQAGQ